MHPSTKGRIVPVEDINLPSPTFGKVVSSYIVGKGHCIALRCGLPAHVMQRRASFQAATVQCSMRRLGVATEQQVGGL